MASMSSRAPLGPGSDADVEFEALKFEIRDEGRARANDDPTMDWSQALGRASLWEAGAALRKAREAARPGSDGLYPLDVGDMYPATYQRSKRSNQPRAVEDEQLDLAGPRRVRTVFGRAVRGPDRATGSPRSGEPGGASAQRRPELTLEQILALQKELYNAFADEEFQRKLEGVEARHGKAHQRLTSEHTELFLSVQNAVLPKYGFEEGHSGVLHMLDVASQYNYNEQLQKNRLLLNQLIGMAPLATEEDGGEERARGEAAPRKPEPQPPGPVATEPPSANAGAAGSREPKAEAGTGENIPEELRFARQQFHQWRTQPEDQRRLQLAERHRMLEELRGQAEDGQARSVRREKSEMLSDVWQQHRQFEKRSSNRVPSRAAERERGASRGKADRGKRHDRAAEEGPPGDGAKPKAVSEEDERHLHRWKEKREKAKQAWQGERCFLVVGGENGVGSLDTTEVLDAAAMAFGPGPRMRSQRNTCTAADLGDGRFLVIGGSIGAKCLETSEVLDMKTMAFAHGPHMSSRRAACASATLDDRRILVCGGRDKSARLDTTEVLDLTSMVFTPGPRMIERRTMCTAVLLDGSRLMVIGGHNGTSALDTTELLNLESMRFVPGPRMGSRRFSCAAAMMDEGHLLVCGGVGDGSNRLNSSEVLDLATMAFTPGPRMGLERSGCAMVKLDARRLLVLGGFDGKARHSATEVLDVGSMSFAPGPPMGVQRGGCAAVFC